MRCDYKRAKRGMLWLWDYAVPTHVIKLYWAEHTHTKVQVKLGKIWWQSVDCMIVGILVVILLNFYWSVVVSQCCFSFYYLAKWISHTYTHIPSFLVLILCYSLWDVSIEGNRIKAQRIPLHFLKIACKFTIISIYNVWFKKIINFENRSETNERAYVFIL